MDPTEKRLGGLHQYESHTQKKAGGDRTKKTEASPVPIKKGGEPESINKISQFFPKSSLHASSFRDKSRGNVYRGPITPTDIRAMQASTESIRVELASFIMTVLNENGISKQEGLFSGDTINISVTPENFRRQLGKIESGERETDRRRFVVHNDHHAAHQEIFELDGEELDVVVMDDVIDKAVDAIEEYQFIKAALTLARVEKLTEKKTGKRDVKAIPTDKNEARISQNNEEKKEMKRESGSAHRETLEGLRKEKRKSAMREQEKDDQNDAINKGVVREAQRKHDKRIR